MLHFIYLVILTAFIFDFINGFHDASNSIATIVATGVLKPTTAVIWAAFFNFIAFLFFHLNVASTIGIGLVSADSINTYVIFAALIGAISFNLLTWYFGLPSSSSHALIGGLIGAAVTNAGWTALQGAGLIKVIVAIVISPLLGLVLAVVGMQLIKICISNTKNPVVQRWSRHFQLISAALLSLGHGGNDAQKTMGIIAILLFTSQLTGPHFYVPLWVVISCHFVIALGTLAGGWRIVHTLGKKITKLEPLNASVAESASAITLILATYLGIPVSTTHTVTGAITGIGIQNGWLSTNWGIIKRIVWAWIFTIPAAAIFASGIVWLNKIL